ncbi:GNAT family N-acetyltransferase [Nocardia sp. NPDC056952]|uniref:GNAT family N-acetyltransferase n=1 Tax=Nocardia sp. NPDC056952 TaxID=3345979 RepID=UPI0036288317
MMSKPLGHRHIRTTIDADMPSIRALLDTSFGGRHTDNQFAAMWHNFSIDQSLVAVTGQRLDGNLIGGTHYLTTPGGAEITAAAATACAVNPIHRRQGVLRALLTEFHHRARAASIPMAILMASQAGIYGRYGYGPCTRITRITLDRSEIRWLPTTPDPGGAEFVSMDEAAELVPEIYQRWRKQTPGAQLRPETAWAPYFGDGDDGRPAGSEYFVLIHPDGYAIYRYQWNDQGGTIRVQELRYLTPNAHAALWRALAGMDPFYQIDAPVAADDPLPYMLTDPRLVKLTYSREGLWTRLLDIPTALQARTYQHDIDVVIQVDDSHYGGTFELSVRDGLAECTPTTKLSADISLGIDVLSSLYFGGHRARNFATANRLRARSMTILQTMDKAFTAEREPLLGWHF